MPVKAMKAGGKIVYKALKLCGSTDFQKINKASPIKENGRVQPASGSFPQVVPILARETPPVHILLSLQKGNMHALQPVLERCRCQSLLSP